jgi:hypothetical protein
VERVGDATAERCTHPGLCGGHEPLAQMLHAHFRRRQTDHHGHPALRPEPHITRADSEVSEVKGRVLAQPAGWTLFRVWLQG